MLLVAAATTVVAGDVPALPVVAPVVIAIGAAAAFAWWWPGVRYRHWRYRLGDDALELSFGPIIPGVMLFVNVPSVYKMSAVNNTEVPGWLQDRLDKVEGQPTEVRKLAVEVSTALIQELLAGGAPGIHLYTMNFPKGTQDVYANLGLGPRA